jgi:hypothetical protein
MCGGGSAGDPVAPLPWAGVCLLCVSVRVQLSYGCTGIGTAMEANSLAESPVLVAGKRRGRSSTPCVAAAGVGVPSSSRRSTVSA